MQLFVIVKKNWHCVEVNLINGSTPCIGGTASDQRIEPARWFKVLVLDTICVDCSERVVSWNIKKRIISSKVSLQENVASDSDSSEATPNLSLSSNHSLVSLCGNSHSLMAAHDESTDDMQALFELAQTLITCPQEAEHQNLNVEQWLKLLHCYLLPLITFQCEDLEAVSCAQDDHIQLLRILDQNMEEISKATLKVKEELSTLLFELLPCVGDWAVQNYCSSKFLSLVIMDIKIHEQDSRAKIQSSARNIDFNESLHTSLSGERYQQEKFEAEQQLLKLLKVRSVLEGADGHLACETEGSEMQVKYVQLHAELDQYREKSAALSSEKVLALSVREAFEQTVSYLISGQTTSGLDVGLQGGHSTDVLREASPLSANDGNHYLTWREKIQKLLQVQWTPLSELHHQFSQKVNAFLITPAGNLIGPENGEEKMVNSKSLALLVNEHYEKIVDVICQQYDDHNRDFVQRVWLCYERLFFESFSERIFSLYRTEQTKHCQQLMTNAIGLSVIDPHYLELGVVEESWLHLFPPRSFSDALLLYTQVTESSISLTNGLNKESTCPNLPYKKYFSGVSSDLFSLPLAISPLDKLQLLISAFRKAMAGLSQLKLDNNHPMLEDTAVSCDEILPVLVLLVLHLPPCLLAILHINCCLLTDFMAPFLSPGWHGYSLATFTSTLHVINKL